MFGFVHALLVLIVPAGRKGQGLVEYALILLFVAMVVVLLLSAMATKVGNSFTQVNNQIKA